MRVNFGLTKFANKKTNQRENVILDTSRTINGHILLAGASGTGKTHQLRRIISEMSGQEPGIRFHILDVHGDLDTGGASSCMFSESTPYGINPLRVDADPHMGGVRKRARGFISSLSRTSTKLGSKQEAALYNLLNELYEQHGFFADDPASWRVDRDVRTQPNGPKRHPTISDLRALAEWQLKQLATGAGSDALKRLDELSRKVRQFHKRLDKVDDADTAQLDKARTDCIDLYRQFVESIQTGDELLQFIRYSGRDVLQSVYERIRNLESSGVFRPHKPDFDPQASVWRYDISALSRDEQILFVEFVTQEMFAGARRKGHTERPRDFVVIDEAHAFVSDDPDHVLNVVIKEARKFGLGLILASQSLGHFPDDIIANTAVKTILGLDEMFHAQTARKLSIDQKRFTWIVPRKTALVQIKKAGDTSNRYIDVELP